VVTYAAAVIVFERRMRLTDVRHALADAEPSRQVAERVAERINPTMGGVIKKTGYSTK